MEPVVGNEAAIDLDFYSSGSRKRTVQYCMKEGKPALTDRLRLVQEKTESGFGVVLMHPGFNLSEQVAEQKAAEALAMQDGYDGTVDVDTLDIAAYTPEWPRDLASIVVRIPDLLRRAGTSRGEPSVVYLFDKSDSGGSPLFLGAACIEPRSGRPADVTFLPETTVADLHVKKKRDGSLWRDEIVQVANKEWIVSVHSVEGSYKPNVVFVILGGVIIFAASLALAIWLHNNQRRLHAYNKEKMEADAEKATLILDNARKATKAERELNDFIAQ
jgi:hypothetical protein